MLFDIVTVTARHAVVIVFATAVAGVVVVTLQYWIGGDKGD